MVLRGTFQMDERTRVEWCSIKSGLFGNRFITLLSLRVHRQHSARPKKKETSGGTDMLVLNLIGTQINLCFLKIKMAIYPTKCTFCGS